jgi:hypothetical protein
MGLSDATIETYRPQYRPLSTFRYLDVNPISTRYALFITLHTTESCQWGDTKVGWSPAARRGSLNWPGRGPRRRRLRREARRCVLRDSSWHDAGGAQAGPGGSCSFLSLRCRGHGMGWMGDGRWPVGDTGRDHGTVSAWPHIVTWVVPGGPSEFSSQPHSHRLPDSHVQTRTRGLSRDPISGNDARVPRSRVRPPLPSPPHTAPSARHHGRSTELANLYDGCSSI